MSAHTHPDTDRLTFGCDGCINRVKRDQLFTSLPEKSMSDLTAMLRHPGTRSDRALADAIDEEIAARKMEALAE